MYVISKRIPIHFIAMSSLPEIPAVTTEPNEQTPLNPNQPLPQTQALPTPTSPSREHLQVTSQQQAGKTTGLTKPPPTTKPSNLNSLFSRLQPLLFQNPDGSLSQAIPPGFREAPLRVSTRVGFSAASGLLWGELDGPSLAEEVEWLFERHLRVFGGLILL